MIDHIELSIPGQAVFLQLVRLTAGVVAARTDLDLNQMEDLRLAVDELCLSVMGPPDAPGRLVLRYTWDDAVIDVTCTLVPDDRPGDDSEMHRRVHESGHSALDGRQDEDLRQELSSQILDALVDQHGVTSDAETAGAWLRVRRVRPSPIP